MKTEIVKFETIEELKIGVKKSNLIDSEKLLVQIFIPYKTASFIQKLQQYFQKNFPNAVVVGATSDGVIAKQEVFDDEVSIASFLYLEKSRVCSSVVFHESECSCFENGKKLASKLVKEDTKVALLFADGLHTNAEEFVKGFSSVAPKCMIAGGLAGDNGKLEQTFVFDKEQLTDRGVVGVALCGEELKASNAYSFSWLPVGKELIVNRSVQNRVYEIDGLTPVELYSKYLGEEVAKRLPQIGIEFPLILQKDGVDIARAVITKHEDGSLSFAGNVPEGSKVHLGVGDAEIVLKDSKYRVQKFLYNLPFQPETLFIYSCMARRRFLKLQASKEIAFFDATLKPSGFFTYGEFFYAQDGSNLFNETMTILALSESNQSNDKKLFRDIQDHGNYQLSHQYILAHLANVVSKELEELNKSLEEKVEKSLQTIYEKVYFEALTKLPNRLSLIKELDSASGALLVLINIDDFTTINDFYGHQFGDKLLQAFAKKLEPLANELQAKLFKLPSDEFALIVYSNRDQSSIEALAEKILHYIRSLEFTIDQKHLRISATIAVSFIKKDGHGLRDADMTLKKAKKLSKNYLIYHDDLELTKEFEQNLKNSKMLRSALEEDRIVPYFQPIVDVQTKKIVKYEVLARLIDEDGTIVPPALFLDIAKKMKFYSLITTIIIEKSFAYFSKTKEEFSINLSYDDIMDEQTLKFLFQKMKSYGIAQQLTIEILETQSIEYEHFIDEFTKRVYEAGAKIAIDDFGSGYANFEHITKIKSNYLKIDGSLIRDIDTNKNSFLIVETIVSFAKKLGKKTVAEYVHNEKILEIISSLGIDYAQGYLLGKPSEKTLRGA